MSTITEQERLAIEKNFDMTRTGLSYYDTFLTDLAYVQKSKKSTGEIVYMSPLEYLRKAAIGFGTQTTFEKQLRYVKADVDKTLQYFHENPDVKMNLPFLNYSSYNGFSQEGRHRAYVAHLRGLTMIPVLYITDYDGGYKSFEVKG